jgi:hypothetical protein
MRNEGRALYVSRRGRDVLAALKSFESGTLPASLDQLEIGVRRTGKLRPQRPLRCGSGPCRAIAWTALATRPQVGWR